MCMAPDWQSGAIHRLTLSMASVPVHFDNGSWVAYPSFEPGLLLTFYSRHCLEKPTTVWTDLRCDTDVF